MLAARTEDQLRDVAAQVEAAGRRAVVVPGDLTDFDLMASLAETALDEFGRLDIVVNNMGGTMPRPLLDTSPRFLEEAFHFNVSAGHALVRAAVPLMLDGDHPGGAIVNISSVMGHVAGRGYLAYGTVKGALEQYTRLASRDLAPRIRVNAIAVGSTATSALDIVMSSDELRTAMEDATPLKRLGHPDDIASASSSWSSPAGAYVTGKIIEVGRRPAVAQPRVPPPRPLRSTSSMTYRVVQWSTGNVGRHALAGIDAHPELELVGALRLEPGQGRPRRRRAGRARAARSASRPPATSTPCWRCKPDCIVHTAMADDRLVEALADLQALPGGRHQRGLLGPVFLQYPAADDPLAAPAHRGRRGRRACPSSSTASTRASPTTPCPSC